MILAAVILAILAAVFLFRVKTVVVNGNTRHTGQDITSDLSCDFLTRNSLYLLWKYRGGKVPESMPYLSSIKIKMESPSRLSVTVVEKDLVGYLDKEQNIYFDKDGIVLEITDEVYDDVPVVTGVAAADAVLYQKLPTDSSAQLRTILSIVKLLKYQELTAKEIRFSDNMDITVTVGSVDAQLGQDEYLEEKIANLRAILDSMGQKAGTLHMENFTGKNEPVTFRESGEPETETESEDSQEGTADVPEEDGISDLAGDIAGTADDMAAGDSDGAVAGEAAGDGVSGEDTQENGGEEPTPTTFMVFNSSGQLVYDAHVVNGVVVDSSGTPIDGCSVNEDGNVVDAYWNVIDPATGQLAQ